MPLAAVFSPATAPTSPLTPISDTGALFAAYLCKYVSEHDGELMLDWNVCNRFKIAFIAAHYIFPCPPPPPLNIKQPSPASKTGRHSTARKGKANISKTTKPTTAAATSHSSPLSTIAESTPLTFLSAPISTSTSTTPPTPQSSPIPTPLDPKTSITSLTHLLYAATLEALPAAGAQHGLDRAATRRVYAQVDRLLAEPGWRSAFAAWHCLVPDCGSATAGIFQGLLRGEGLAGGLGMGGAAGVLGFGAGTMSGTAAGSGARPATATGVAGLQGGGVGGVATGSFGAGEKRYKKKAFDPALLVALEEVASRDAYEAGRERRRGAAVERQGRRAAEGLAERHGGIPPVDGEQAWRDVGVLLGLFAELLQDERAAAKGKGKELNGEEGAEESRVEMEQQTTVTTVTTAWMQQIADAFLDAILYWYDRRLLDGPQDIPGGGPWESDAQIKEHYSETVVAINMADPDGEYWRERAYWSELGVVFERRARKDVLFLDGRWCKRDRKRDRVVRAVTLARDVFSRAVPRTASSKGSSLAQQVGTRTTR